MACPQYVNSPYGQTLVVTSASRPTGFDLYEGRLIYETDTDKLLVYDGIGWTCLSEPETISSTFATWITAGITVGNGVTTMHYRRNDGDCIFRFLFTFGTTSAVTGNVAFAVPYPGLQYPADIITSYKEGSALFGQVGFWNWTGASSGGLLCHNAAGTYLTFNQLASTAPFTWNANSQLAVSGRYAMVSRYS